MCGLHTHCRAQAQYCPAKHYVILLEVDGKSWVFLLTWTIITLSQKHPECTSRTRGWGGETPYERQGGTLMMACKHALYACHWEQEKPPIASCLVCRTT